MLRFFRFPSHRRILRKSVNKKPNKEETIRIRQSQITLEELQNVETSNGKAAEAAAFKFKHRRLFMQAFDSYRPVIQSPLLEALPRLGDSRLSGRRRGRVGSFYTQRHILDPLLFNGTTFRELSFYTAEQFSDDDDQDDETELERLGRNGILYRANLDDWKIRLKNFIRNDQHVEIISEDRKDRRHFETLASLSKEMGLHCQMYGKVVVISKLPLPHYRPDLDLQRPQREVVIPLVAQRKIETLLERHFRQKKNSLESINENEYLSEDEKDEPMGNQRQKRFNGEAQRMANDPFIIQQNRRLRNKQQSWQTSEEGQKMMDIRKNLPAYKERETLLESISKHQVLVVSGETGCGKTTQLPQYILEAEIEAGRGSTCNIICTQPRRISAISVSERVAAERGEAIGDSVGYQVRLEGMKGRNTHLLFCTTGILLRRLLGDPTLSGVSHVIVDEIHERGMNEDFLLVILKELLHLRPDLRLVLMSATLNAELFSSFFGGAPMAHIPGFTYPVKAHFLEDMIEITGYRLTQVNQIDDYGQERQWKMQRQSLAMTRKKRSLLSGLAEDAQANQDYSKFSSRTQESLSCWNPDSLGFNLIEATLLHICKSGKEGAILVFMIGWEDINALLDQLKRHPFFGDPQKVLLLGCHGSMPTADQKLIFERPPPNIRKIVLATNMAETSITINDVVFVIDLGKAKETSYDALNNTPCLLPSWVSKAAARQRRGRAGRVRPGECYHLYPKATHDAFSEYQMPELLRTPLHSLCLQIKSLQLGNIAEFLSKALQPPEPLAVQNSIEFLKTIGALDDKEELTDLGRHLSVLPLEPRLGKMLIMGCIFRCLDPILSIAAALTTRDPFVMPMDKKDLAEQCKYRFSGEEYSDHIGLVNAFNGWQKAMENETAGDYCWQNFLSMQTMLSMSSLRKQFLGLLRASGFLGEDLDHFNAYSHDGDVVRAVICAGLYPGVASVVKKSKSICFKTFEDGQVLLSNSSVNAADPMYPWLVFNEKIRTNSVQIRDSTGISDAMLLLFGGQLVSGCKPGHLLMQDGYLEFFLNPELATSVLKMQKELGFLLHKKLANPSTNIYMEGRDLMEAVLHFLHGDRCEGTFVFGRVPKKIKASEGRVLQEDVDPNSKNELQSVLQKTGSPLPTYVTRPVEGKFLSNTTIRGRTFVGEPFGSKKDAEKSVAARALAWILTLRDVQETLATGKRPSQRKKGTTKGGFKEKV